MQPEFSTTPLRGGDRIGLIDPNDAAYRRIACHGVPVLPPRVAHIGGVALSLLAVSALALSAAGPAGRMAIAHLLP